jgi:hypothetical protein
VTDLSLPPSGSTTRIPRAALRHYGAGANPGKGYGLGLTWLTLTLTLTRTLSSTCCRLAAAVVVGLAVAQAAGVRAVPRSDGDSSAAVMQYTAPCSTRMLAQPQVGCG